MSNRNIPVNKHWTEYFDQIFLINLPHDRERQAAARKQLAAYNIPFHLVEGIYMDDPEDGIRQTVRNIFYHSLRKGHKRILVFEDDIKIISDPGIAMPHVIEQLAPLNDYWDVLFLGVNTHEPFREFYSKNILPVQMGYGLHAVAYTHYAMAKLLKIFAADTNAIDIAIARHLQPQGNCYATYPLLVTQNNGYSNIQKKHMDQSYIVERFNKNVAHLIK